MAVFSGEGGCYSLQLTSPVTTPCRNGLSSRSTLNEAASRSSGSTTISVSRNIFVLLTAIAAKVPIKLGTAILVPYFRNPIDTADAFASLSELMGGREISVGIARGDYAQAGNQIHMVNPIGMVKETVECLKSLLRGDMVQYAEYPVLSEFFNLRSKSGIQLGFTPQSPILFYSGGNGPRIMEITGRVMDGVLIGGFFIPLVRSGKLAALLEKTEPGENGCRSQDHHKEGLRDQHFDIEATTKRREISRSDTSPTCSWFSKRWDSHRKIFSALGVDRETVIQIKVGL